MLRVQVCSASTGFNECHLYSHSCKMLFIPTNLVGSELHRNGAREEARELTRCKWRTVHNTRQVPSNRILVLQIMFHLDRNSDLFCKKYFFSYLIQSDFLKVISSFILRRQNNLLPNSFFCKVWLVSVVSVFCFVLFF